MAVNGDTINVEGVNFSTEKAMEETMLSPRFYTTDFDAIDKINIEGVRDQWDELMMEFAISSVLPTTVLSDILKYACSACIAAVPWGGFPHKVPTGVHVLTIRTCWTG